MDDMDCNKLTHQQELLVTENIKLVPYILKENIKHTSLVLDHYEDILSEGNVGLVKAAKTFNPDSNYKFSTYASMVIKNAMLMYIRVLKKDYDRTISIDSTITRTNKDDEITFSDVLEGDNNIEEFIQNDIKNDYIEKLYKYVSELKGKRRAQILKLRLKGYKIVEIASLLNINPSNVSSALNKGIIQLRKLFMNDTEIKNNKCTPDNKMPKRADYPDESSWRKDYNHYRYLKLRNRENKQ